MDEMLVVVWEVTDWIDGTVAKTREVGKQWVPYDPMLRAPKGFVYSPPPADEWPIFRKAR